MEIIMADILITQNDAGKPKHFHVEDVTIIMDEEFIQLWDPDYIKTRTEDSDEEPLMEFRRTTVLSFSIE